MSKQVRDQTLVLIFVVIAVISMTIIGVRWHWGGPTAEARTETFSKRFVVVTPDPFQLFQRDKNGLADIPVQLSVYGGLSGQVSARWNNSDWQVLEENFKGTEFSGSLKNQSVGQGELEVKIASLPSKFVETVSVGDILLCDGQSNNTGVFDEQYQLPSDLKFKPTMYRLDAKSWMPLKDPVNPYYVFFELEDKGSVWPIVAELYQKEYDVPVAIVDVSMGGSGLVTSLADTPNNDWISGHDPYKNLIKAVGLATDGKNTFKLLLSFRGETDAIMGVTTQDYLLGTIEHQQRLIRDLGRGEFPIVVGQIAYFTEWKHPTIPGIFASVEEIDAIRLAQQEVVDGVNFFSGPDGSKVEIGPDKIHFSSSRAKRDLAEFWLDSIRGTIKAVDEVGVQLANK